jgi:hypothetical protein
MYDAFITQRNAEFLRRATSHLSKEFGWESHAGFWVCYGSFVTNQQVTESDIDLLYVQSHEFGTPERASSRFEGHPVTLYRMCKRDYASDGTGRNYGGYFAGKALNPFTADSNLVLRTCGGFIGDWAAAIGRRRTGQTATSANITADVMLARLQICPWLRSYGAKWFAAPSFPRLWFNMCDFVPAALAASGHVIRTEGGYSYAAPTIPRDMLQEARVRAIARFWSLGSALHGNDLDFSEKYVRKCQAALTDPATNLASRSLLMFLQTEAGLQ